MQLLNCAQRSSLTLYFDDVEARTKEIDVKVDLTWEKLAALVGADGSAQLQQFVATYAKCAGGWDDVVRRGRVKLRRCAAHGRCIPFHLDDTTQQVMQVPLNGDDTYVGGRLVFASPQGTCVPVRPAGSATLHNCKIVHGVTALQTGVRYSLYVVLL